MSWIESAPAVVRIASLRRAGMTMNGIAEASGISDMTLRRIAKNPRCLSATVDAILTIPLPDDLPAYDEGWDERHGLRNGYWITRRGIRRWQNATANLCGPQGDPMDLEDRTEATP